jgi:hypothetical protein
MVLRIDGDLDIAFEAAKHLMNEIGTITQQTHDNVMGTVSHPDGRQVKLNLIVYRAITEPADYLELNRRSGDALLGAEVHRMLLCLLTSQYAPQMAGGVMAMLPPPPGLCALHRTRQAKQTKPPLPKAPAQPPPPKPCPGPAAAPLDVPHLSLGVSKEEEELAWSTLDSLAWWPREDVRDFAFLHDDVCTSFARGRLGPQAFEEHMLKIPPDVRKALKWFKRHWNCLPPNTSVLLEQVTMLLAEAEAFWILHAADML